MAAVTSEMRGPPKALVEHCLATLRGLGSSVEVDFAFDDDAKLPLPIEGELQLRLGRKAATERFLVRVTRSHLSYALVRGLIAEMRSVRANWVLFAPYVPAAIGRELAGEHASYVDAVGNCHLLADHSRHLLVHVEGKKPDRASHVRGGGRLPSYQVLFAIVAKPSLLEEPVRRIAEVAGVGKTAVAEQLERLQRQGTIERARSGAWVADRDALLHRWLTAYADTVRPRSIVGRYRTQTTDPEALEKRLRTALGDTTWALGGGAAAWRMTKFYRGPDTIVHVDRLPSDFTRELRALPSPDGGLTVLRAPGRIAYEGAGPHLAHPLLVYSEMLASNDPRMREAAQEIRERFLPESSG